MLLFILFSHTAVWSGVIITLQILNLLKFYRKELFVLLPIQKLMLILPLFAKLNLLKLQDIITLYIACFMYNYSNSNIPNAFNSFFTAVNKSHTYNTRLASKSSFVFPKVRTNYGKFNIRFLAPKIRNEIEESLKNLSFRIFFNGNSKLIFSVYRILIKNELYIEFCQIMHFVVHYMLC